MNLKGGKTTDITQTGQIFKLKNHQQWKKGIYLIKSLCTLNDGTTNQESQYMKTFYTYHSHILINFLFLRSTACTSKGKNKSRIECHLCLSSKYFNKLRLTDQTKLFIKFHEASFHAE